jgi:hypothetical protein
MCEHHLRAESFAYQMFNLPTLQTRYKGRRVTQHAQRSSCGERPSPSVLERATCRGGGRAAGLCGSHLSLPQVCLDQQHIVDAGAV